MVTIQFQNGTKASFEGNPTPQDVDYVAQQAGVKSNQLQVSGGPGGFGSMASNYPSQVGAAFSSGVDQVKQGYQQFADSGTSPLGMLEGAAKGGAGIVNAAYSPLAPFLSPIGAGVNAAADKISDIPAVQSFAQTGAGQAVARGAEDVGNVSSIAMGELPFMAKPAAGASSAIQSADTFPAKPLSEFPDKVVPSELNGGKGVVSKVYTSPGDQILFQEHSLYSMMKDADMPVESGTPLPQSGVEGRIADYKATLNGVEPGMGDMWAKQFTGADLSKVTPEQMTTITRGASDLADNPVQVPGSDGAAKPSVSRGNQMTIQARTDTYNQLGSKYASVSNAIDNGTGKGFNVVDDLSKDDRFTPEIDKDGRIDASMAIKNLNDFVKPIAQVERQAIEAEGQSYSFDKFASDVRKSIMQYKPRGASYNTMLSRVNADLDVYRNAYAQDGTISGVNLDDIKNAKYQIANWNDEDAQISDKAVARVARKTIFDGTKSADLKQLNSDMSRYYSARDVLDSVDNKIVRGGRLGKYFARTIGTGIGAHFGPLGGIAGMYTGDALETAAMQHKFNPIFASILRKDSLETPQPQSVSNTTAMLSKAKLPLPLPRSSE